MYFLKEKNIKGEEEEQTEQERLFFLVLNIRLLAVQKRFALKKIAYDE